MSTRRPSIGCPINIADCFVIARITTRTKMIVGSSYFKSEADANKILKSIRKDANAKYKVLFIDDFNYDPAYKDLELKTEAPELTEIPSERRDVLEGIRYKKNAANMPHVACVPANKNSVFIVMEKDLEDVKGKPVATERRFVTVIEKKAAESFVRSGNESIRESKWKFASVTFDDFCGSRAGYRAKETPVDAVVSACEAKAMDREKGNPVPKSSAKGYKAFGIKPRRYPTTCPTTEPKCFSAVMIDDENQSVVMLSDGYYRSWKEANTVAKHAESRMPKTPFTNFGAVTIQDLAILAQTYTIIEPLVFASAV